MYERDTKDKNKKDEIKMMTAAITRIKLEPHHKKHEKGGLFVIKVPI